MSSNLPPGVTDSMLPGNRPEDMENERAWDELHSWLDDLAVYIAIDPVQLKKQIVIFARKQNRNGWREFVISRQRDSKRE